MATRFGANITKPKRKKLRTDDGNPRCKESKTNGRDSERFRPKTEAVKPK